MLLQVQEHLVRMLFLIAKSQRHRGVDDRDLAFIQFQCVLDGFVRIRTSVDHPACVGYVEQSAGPCVLLLCAPRRLIMSSTGDWASCTRSAWFSVVSNTASPVLLIKSATMMLSFELAGLAAGSPPGATNGAGFWDRLGAQMVAKHESSTCTSHQY
jgi:hypothetical protein